MIKTFYIRATWLSGSFSLDIEFCPLRYTIDLGSLNVVSHVTKSTSSCMYAGASQ